MKPEEIKNMPLEETFLKIDEIMDKLSNDETSLAESFEQYKEGMDLLKHCSDEIDRVEQQVKLLSADGSEYIWIFRRK